MQAMWYSRRWHFLPRLVIDTGGWEKILKAGMSPRHGFQPRNCNVTTSIAQAYSQHPALGITGTAVQ